jgi:hypothetical protein
MKIISIFCLLLLLFGCATVSDIKSMPPDLIMESNLSPKEIAICVSHKAPEEVSNPAVPYYNFSLTEDQKGGYYLLASIPAQPMGEVAFLPHNNGGTLIQFRYRWNFWGHDALWSCINKCACPKTPPGNSWGR